MCCRVYVCLFVCLSVLSYPTNPELFLNLPSCALLVFSNLVRQLNRLDFYSELSLIHTTSSRKQIFDLFDHYSGIQNKSTSFQL